MAWAAAEKRYAPVLGLDEDPAIEQADNRLVDQSAGLQGVVGPLAPHEAGGHPTQLTVDGADQPVLGVHPAGAGRVEQSSQVIPGVVSHWILRPSIQTKSDYTSRGAE